MSLAKAPNFQYVFKDGNFEFFEDLPGCGSGKLEALPRSGKAAQGDAGKAGAVPNQEGPPGKRSSKNSKFPPDEIFKGNNYE